MVCIKFKGAAECENDKGRETKKKIVSYHYLIILLGDYY